MKLKSTEIVMIATAFLLMASAGWFANNYLTQNQLTPQQDVDGLAKRLTIYDTYFNQTYVRVPVCVYEVGVGKRWHGTVYEWKRLLANGKLEDVELITDIVWDNQVQWMTVECARVTSMEVVVKLDGEEKFRFPQVTEQGIGTVQPGYYILIVH